MNIIHCETEIQALKQAAAALHTALEAARARQHHVLLLLSGGSNLGVAKQLGAYLDHESLTIYPLDERYSADSAVNNSLQLHAAGIPIQLVVPEDGESLQAFGQRFSGELSAWLTANPAGEVIATLGMGPDGHIAGISPMRDAADTFQKIFYEVDDSAVGYEGNLSPPERITVTPQFLTKKINVMVGLVTGQAKAAALEMLQNTPTPVHEQPAQLLKQARGLVQIFACTK